MAFDPQEFSELRLRNLLLTSREEGYAPIFFGDEDNFDKFVIWRHDIDIDLSAVIPFATLEAEAGIPANYFLMTRSCFYNLFSREGLETVTELLRLGHRVGLHCDLGIEREAATNQIFVKRIVEQDFKMIDTFFGEGVFTRIVSFHNPPNSVLKETYDNFYSTYQEKFFGEIKYLSDSNRIWREGPPEQWFASKDMSRYSILLHPIIWSYPGRTMPEFVSIYLKGKLHNILQQLIQDGIIVA